MPLKKENPKYNVLSFRATNEELKLITAAINGGSHQDFLLAATLEKILRDEGYAFRERVASALAKR